MKRSAYTLLEVLLALAIAALLMGALYVGVEVQMRYAQAGRERVDESTLARRLLRRIGADVASALTPIRSSSSGASDSVGAPTNPGMDEPPVATISAVMPFSRGVQGDADVLVLYQSKVPDEAQNLAEGETPTTGVSDIHRVAYWLVGDGGLARQEVARVTADDESTQVPPDVSNPGDYIIAPTIVQLKFEYFDGTSWTATWDGATAGDDGATPIGPPRAVAITLGVKSESDGRVRTYRHVVAVQTANAQPTTSATEEMP